MMDIERGELVLLCVLLGQEVDELKEVIRAEHRRRIVGCICKFCNVALVDDKRAIALALARTAAFNVAKPK